MREELANFQALVAHQQRLLDALNQLPEDTIRAIFRRLGVEEPNRYENALQAFSMLRSVAMTSEGSPIRTVYLAEGATSGNDLLYVHLEDPVLPVGFAVCAVSGGGFLGRYETGSKLKDALGV